MFHPGVTREWVDEGQLPKEQTQSENTEVLKQVVKRGEEATMNPEGLSYPKAECRLERTWTRRSATEVDLPVAKKGMQMQDNGY
ncbi:hypothetical protein B296_00000665 [Ensete ventricosum]|uniref:Uncharacterized protein n=1 Tax=Ensete ventricosum TaxID=4639 RepID=A0A426Z0R7_ENSVE|nr:hypothetical protein B296_00000665 [Ensete ventricosum]